ncbi:SusC/RagA family TonB-linked outer membrane protein [Bacteroidia bacterium]|nr:SusC/RagA family TonB-linked outer membrane protein [Bacteroidia bacterium]
MALKATAQNVPVSLNLQNTKLEKVLSDIEKQTNYLFVYNKSVDVQRSVSIVAENKNLREVLQQLFAGTPVVFAVERSNIVLSTRESTPPKTRTVEGRVVDGKGEPLAGVIVQTKGGPKVATTTSATGGFNLVIDENAGALIFSMMGMEPKEVAVGSARTFNVALDEQATSIDDVVVTALGIKRSEKALAYNVQQVSSDELNMVKSENFVNQLAGKVSGLEIKSVSGGVGTATRVTLRGGARNLSGSSPVLYVVDGMPLTNGLGSGITDEFSSEVGSEGIADFNPEDIESISVLTGASASALYGSKATDGVILITTKKGTAGKTKLSYSNQTTFLTPAMMPKFQKKYGNELNVFETWGSELATPSSYDPADFFRTGSNIQHSLTFSGGTERNQTYVSLGAINAGGIIQNNNYERYNLTARNTSTHLNDKLTLDISFNYMKQWDRNLVAQGEYFNPVVPIYLFPRGEAFDPVRAYEKYDEGRGIYVQSWDYGTQSLSMQNPYWEINRNIFEHNKQRFVINPTVSYQILDWLNVSARLRKDYSYSLHTRKLYATTDGLLVGTNSKGLNNGNFRYSDNTNDQIYVDAMVRASKTFGRDYKLDAIVGASLEDNNETNHGNGGSLERVPNVFSKWNLYHPGGFGDDGRDQTQSIFVSAELGWKNTLFLTLTGRRDWASQMATGLNSKYGFSYPSVGLSGLISELVKLPKPISYLKVRASLAGTGKSIPARLWSPWEYDPYSLQGYVATKTRPPGELHPMMTWSREVGVDIRLFDSSLRLEGTYYHTNTFDQTMKVGISAASGYSNMWIQTGNVRNQGIELMASYRKQWGKFVWGPSLTASWNENKIIDLGSGVDPFTGEIIVNEQVERSTIGSIQNRLVSGGTFGDWWSIQTLQRDYNGNVFVNDKGMMATTSELIKMGTNMAKWRFGFRNDLSWNGINLGILFTARTGGLVLSRTQAMLDYYGVSQASADLRDAGGKPINNGTVSAQTWYQTIGGKQGVYKYYLYNADNVRLQELRIGYSLPSKWFGGWVKLNVAAVGSNLWMIYNKAPFDPEATASTNDSYQGVDYFMQPSMRTLGFSVKLDF